MLCPLADISVGGESVPLTQERELKRVHAEAY